MVVWDGSTGFFLKRLYWRFLTLGGINGRPVCFADLHNFHTSLALVGSWCSDGFTCTLYPPIHLGVLHVLKFKPVLTQGSLAGVDLIKGYFYCSCYQNSGKRSSRCSVLCHLLIWVEWEVLAKPLISSMFNVCQILWQVPKCLWAQHLKPLFVAKQCTTLTAWCVWNIC